MLLKFILKLKFLQEGELKNESIKVRWPQWEASGDNIGVRDNIRKAQRPLETPQ